MNDIANQQSATSFDATLSNVQQKWDTALSAPQSTPAQSAALDQRTLKAFEDAAVKYNVPVDVLMAMGEKDSGFDATARSKGPGPKTRGIIKMDDADVQRAAGANPYVQEQNIDYAAGKLRSMLDNGLSVPDAIKAISAGNADPSSWGPQASDYAADVLGRTKRLKDTYYPPEPAPQPQEAPQEPQKAADPGILGNMNDARVALDQGMNMIAQDVDGVARKILPTRVMEALDTADKWLNDGKTGAELSDEANKRLSEEYSPKMRESLQKKWWDSDKGTFGDALSDWRSYSGAILQSLPESVISSGPALKLAKGVFALNIARGAAPALAAARAATAATVAGAVTEGGFGGAQSEREVRDDIEKMPIETLRQSDAFKALTGQGMSEDAARQALARDMGTRAFVTGGLATAAFGGMGDRIIAKTFLGKEGVKGVTGLLQRLGASGLGEGLAEELPQSALQQMAQNEAEQHADPNKSLMDDVANQAVGGAIAGGVMGVGMGGAFHGATHDMAHEAAAQAAPPPAAPQEPPAARQRGPLSGALEGGAPHVAPLADIGGKRVVLTDRLGQIPGHVIAQDADGLLFKGDDGQEQLVSHEEIANGQTRLVAAPEAPVQAERSPLPPAETGPSAEAVKEPVVSHEASVGENQSGLPVTGQEQQVEQPAEVTRASAPAREEATVEQRQDDAAGQSAVPAEAPRLLSEMTEPELRQRLKAVAAMTKANESNAELRQARRDVEAEINRRAETAPTNRSTLAGMDERAEPAKLGRPWLAKAEANEAPGDKASIAAEPADIGMTSDALRESLTSGRDGDLIGRMFDSGRVTVHENHTTLPEGERPVGGRIQGVTQPDGAIHLVARSLSPGTARGVLLHEAFHSGVEPLVGSKGWTALMGRLQPAIEAAMARESAGRTHPAGDFWTPALRRAREAGVPAKHLAEEVAAYAVENRERAPAGIRESIDRFIGHLKAWALQKFGRQFGDVTPAQLHSLAQAALRSWKDEPRIHASAAGPRYSMASREQERAGTSKTLFAKASDRASDFLTDAMGRNERFNILKLVPVRPLFLELAKGMPSAKHYIDTKQAMDAMRHRLNNEDGHVLDKWSNWVREGLGKKNKAENKQLMDLMHESTLAQVDPSKPFESFFTKADEEKLRKAEPDAPEFDRLAKAKNEEDQRRSDWRDMTARFDKLSPMAKELYREVRDAYAKRADDTEKEVIANIQRALDAMQRRAREDHAQEIERIDAMGLKGKERSDAIDAADNKLAFMETRVRRNRAARVKRLREQFESNRLKGPYFPLQRFGQYFVTVRNKEGHVVNFSRFEDAAKQRAFYEDMASNKDFKVERGALERKISETVAPDTKFVGDVDSILEGANAPSELRDQVWQRYLESLSDMSMRKHRIHRKGRAGYHEDALRAFAFNAFHSAHQLSRLRYGMELQNHIDAARNQIADADHPVRAMHVFNEMLNAHNFAMNPRGNPLSYRATSLAFLYTMGWNLSSALVVLHDPVVRGIPNLGYDAKTGSVGVKKAAEEMAGAAIDLIRGRGSVENSSGLSSDERQAIEDAKALNVIEATNAHDLAGIAETGVNYNPWWNAFMRTSSLPLHHAERANREVTFLAAYRIARKKGLSHAEAVKNAADLTWMSQFDTQASSKPAFMRGDVGRVMFALRNFHANILYRFFRDLHQSLHGLDPEEKKAAIGRFTSTLLITTGMAGIPGSYLASYIIPLAAWALAQAGLRDPDKDPEEELRKLVLESAGDSMIGRAVGGMMMDGVPGYLTGIALTDRIGVPDIGVRASDRDLNPEQAWNYWLQQLGGPTASVLQSMARGAGKLSHGEIQRGLEDMLPAAFKNVSKAIRYSQEGVRDKDGNAILENVAPQDIAKKAVGFQPAEIADRYKRNSFQRNEQERIHHEKSDALRTAARARMAGDSDAKAKAQAQVERFNERFPEARIKPKSIKSEIKRLRHRADRMQYGVDLDPSLSDRIGDETAPSIYSR